LSASGSNSFWANFPALAQSITGLGVGIASAVSAPSYRFAPVQPQGSAPQTSAPQSALLSSPVVEIGLLAAIGFAIYSMFVRGKTEN